ncbi:MAG: hypothetical protein E7376_01270 [Clostridiales bacterium]|nr:hypothetical protein [Clostridiales bacterium]
MTIDGIHTFATIQANLINIEIGLSNNTLSRETAVKHIKSLLDLTELVKERTAPSRENMKAIKDISKLLLEKCTTPYPGLNK